MARYTNQQVRGVLLEEAIAALLTHAGFALVTSSTGDPTLKDTSAGIAVKGRGTGHQIDVICDFEFVSPFTNQPRLLIEGKFLSNPVGVGVVRNALGVLRDVSEWFLPQEEGSSRYHYQSAIFSASRFSKPAQRYAFAHDIVLFPLAENALFAPVTEAIGRFDSADALSSEMKLHEVRSAARDWLLNEGSPPPSTGDELATTLMEIQTAVARIGQAYVARTTRGLPLFLVPTSPQTVERIEHWEGAQRMTVHYSRNEGWTLRAHTQGGQTDFAFDLPRELLRVFNEEGRLEKRKSLDMKAAHFEEIHAYRVEGDRVQTMVLKLDQSWLQSAHDALEQT